MTPKSISLVVLLFGLASAAGNANGAIDFPWLFNNQESTTTPTNSHLEREVSPSTSHHLKSPAQIARASEIFNGRITNRAKGQDQFDNLNNILNGRAQRLDFFECVDPTRAQFETFARLYNRSFNGDSAEQLERLNLFTNTLKRTILFNRIIQNEILTVKNNDAKPAIGNFYFISPFGSQNAALWYSDITDCELGLIKYILFDLFYLIDKNEMAVALKLALDNVDHLPLLNSDGFEQLANILLVRLYDRFRGDDQMNQLFQWPLYLKKLAGYAYNRRQALSPDFKLKMPLVAFVYPTYFKDLKYNAPAVNRTGDNLRVHSEHEKFNKIHDRKFASRQERNMRLVIFRQRWSLLNALNDEETKRSANASIQADWDRVNPSRSSLPSSAMSERLRDPNGQDQLASETVRFRQTRFSDLTDAEFVAYMTNDFSLLTNSKESADFIDRNFPIRPLDEEFRQELAAELEIRRGILSKDPENQVSLSLACQVIDELISDVGLPVGSVFDVSITDRDHYDAFNRISEFFKKPYAMSASKLRQSTLRYTTEPQFSSSGVQSFQLTDTDLADERLRRFEQFKQNYGRIRTWWTKENWLNLDESQSIAMLRLADMSWTEIKFSLFKICCLTEDNLAILSGQNATIQYLGSNEFLCQSMSGLEPNVQFASDIITNSTADLAATELYYYYSVHFNKHHANADAFNQHFAIFRRNIDQIRQHSCTRGLTLFSSLELKKAETLSTIDPLDPRRSFTDDINLDRYDYFSVPNVDVSRAGDTSGFSAKLRTQSQIDDILRRRQQSDRSRAGISYRKSNFFDNLQEDWNRLAKLQDVRDPSGYSFADKLTLAAQNHDLHSLKYRQNNVAKIYDLVMQRYRYCMRTIKGVNLGANLSQQCQAATGSLSDASASPNINLWAANSGTGAELAKLKQEPSGDPCAFYRMGLEPWAEGLTPQDIKSAQLISVARC